MQARIEELLQERKAQSLTAVLSLEAELADARSALAQVPTRSNCWDLNRHSIGVVSDLLICTLKAWAAHVCVIVAPLLSWEASVCISEEVLGS